MAKKRESDTASRLALRFDTANEINRPTPSKATMKKLVNERYREASTSGDYDKKKDTAQRYVESGRMTPDNLKSRLSGAHADIHLAGWKQERKRDAEGVSGNAARQEKIAQKNIQRNQSRQGNQERERRSNTRKTVENATDRRDAKARILQAIKKSK